jgi:hypothetical protein
MTMEQVINILMVEDDTLDVMDAQRTLDPHENALQNACCEKWGRGSGCA